MDGSEQYCSSEAKGGRTTSRAISDILTVLRAIAERESIGNIADLNSHRLAAEEIKNNYRSFRSSVADSKIITAVNCACATAAVISMLQMLSTYFE